MYMYMCIHSVLRHIKVAINRGMCEYSVKTPVGNARSAHVERAFNSYVIFPCSTMIINSLL